MSDIDLIPTYDGIYEITFGESERVVSGNVSLLNRFQITFFDNGMFFNSTNGVDIADDFGGKAYDTVGSSRALSDIEGITASLTAAINNTVESIKRTTDEDTVDTEKLDKAKLVSVDVIKGVITAIIDVYPVELESLTLPRFNVPIISR